jgi:hypothetical protein
MGQFLESTKANRVYLLFSILLGKAIWTDGWFTWGNLIALFVIILYAISFFIELYKN